MGVYSKNKQGGKAAELRDRIYEIVSGFKHVIQMHGFHVDEKNKEISFDIVIGFDVKNRNSFLRQIYNELQKEIPNYTFEVVLDSDFSD